VCISIAGGSTLVEAAVVESVGCFFSLQAVIVNSVARKVMAMNALCELLVCFYVLEIVIQRN
jgi:hypothetical protein